MIVGAHTIVFADDAEAARAFFADVLGLRAVDAGGGGPIFAPPPGELACPPATGGSGRHGRALMCRAPEAPGRGYVGPAEQAGHQPGGIGVAGAGRVRLLAGRRRRDVVDA